MWWWIITIGIAAVYFIIVLIYGAVDGMRNPHKYPNFLSDEEKDAKRIGSSERTIHKIATAQCPLYPILHFTQPKN